MDFIQKFALSALVMSAPFARATQDCVDFRTLAQSRRDAHLPCASAEIAGAERRCLEELRFGQADIKANLDKGKKAKDRGYALEGRARTRVESGGADERHDPNRARNEYTDGARAAIDSEKEYKGCVRQADAASASFDLYTENADAYLSTDPSCRGSTRPPELKDYASEAVTLKSQCQTGIGQARGLYDRAQDGIARVDEGSRNRDEGDRH